MRSSVLSILALLTLAVSPWGAAEGAGDESCPAIPGFSAQFDGEHCFVGPKPPKGFVWQDRWYYMPYDSCSKGLNDGINCQLGEAPPGTTASEWHDGFYYTPIPSCEPLAGFNVQFDGTNCYLGPKPPKGSVWQNHWYYMPYDACSKWENDGINCRLAEAPAGTTASEWHGNFYFTPLPGHNCPHLPNFETQFFDGNNCYVGPKPPNAFVWQSKFYYMPYDACSKGQNDGVNCQLGEAPAGTTASEWHDGFYYTPIPSCKPVAGFETRFDGNNCYLGQKPRNGFVWQNHWYYMPYDACSRGQDDGLNCQLGEAPAGTRAFEANDAFYYYPTMTRGQRYRVAIMRRAIRSAPMRCGLSVTGTYNLCPTTPDERSCWNGVNTTGDSNLYDGILCLSGEQVSCEAVKQAQGADGRWWRSPALVDFDCMTGQGENAKHSFSRDMALGTLSYFTATRARGMSEREQQYARSAGLSWLKYILSHDELMCTDDSWPLHDFCGLNHWWSIFFVSNEYFGIFRDVYDYVYDGIGSAYFRDQATAADSDRRKSACEYIDSQHWTFQVDLLAHQYFIKRAIENVSQEDKAGIWCLIASFVDSPYYNFLVEGSSKKVADLMLAECRNLSIYPPNCLIMANLLIGPDVDVNANGVDDIIEQDGPPRLAVTLKPGETDGSGLFNVAIDGTIYGWDLEANGGSTGPVPVTSGQHLASVTAGYKTDLQYYTTIFDGACGQDGSVTLGSDEEKTCTVTVSGSLPREHGHQCAATQRCCESAPDGGCLLCIPQQRVCP